MLTWKQYRLRFCFTIAPCSVRSEANKAANRLSEKITNSRHNLHFAILSTQCTIVQLLNIRGKVIGVMIAEKNFLLASPSRSIRKMSCKASIARLFAHQSTLNVFPVLVP